MSRDWTPRELHHVDKAMEFSKSTLYFTDKDGVKHMLYDPESEQAKKYPNMTFLFENHVKELLEAYGKDAEKVLADTETELAELIKYDDEYPIQKKEGVVWDWYSGKLDAGFYYREYNDDLFYVYLEEKIKEGKNNGKE